LSWDSGVADPKGNNVVIITGAGGSGGAASRMHAWTRPVFDGHARGSGCRIPQVHSAFGPPGIRLTSPVASRRPRYQNTVRLGLEDPRIHALILGYWHTIITRRWCLRG